MLAASDELDRMVTESTEADEYCLMSIEVYSSDDEDDDVDGEEEGEGGCS